MTLWYRRLKPGAAALLSRHDLIYVLSLLLPFAVYDLALKLLLINPVQQDPEITEALGLMQIRLPAPEPPGFLDVLGLMQSDILFNLGYILLWIALLAVVRKGMCRWIMAGLFHCLT